VAERTMDATTWRVEDVPLDLDDAAAFETLDRAYRALCAVLFNYVPTSGHPGGSISSGRFVARALFESMDYDLMNPHRQDADMMAYAAGHKAMGLYAIWALRDEVARIAAPDLLATSELQRLRLEDLLGFRTNPTVRQPLARQFNAKPLDGHPTPATPFVRLASGASGVGFASAVGLAIAARDYFGENAPRVHIVEGEGGLTPGRVSEAAAAAATAGLDNVVVHLDFNQASIDSNRVCRESDEPGEYVQWTPSEFFGMHGWRVLNVNDGHDLAQVAAAQRAATALGPGAPTAIVYRTTKGWRYGIEGRASHGSGHPMCSDGFFTVMGDLGEIGASVPMCDPVQRTCAGARDAEQRERCFYGSLVVIRRFLEEHRADVDVLAERLRAARSRLESRDRSPRPHAPRVTAIYELAATSVAQRRTPDELVVTPGTTLALKDALGQSLAHLNVASNGAVLTASADLLGSTSAALAGKAFAPGFFHVTNNPESRQISVGGICEDGMSGVLSGVAGFGEALGVGSSYGAFLAPLGHISARLHAIGQQARSEIGAPDFATLILICGHAGLATGEDGPTHADPQALQLLSQNFPRGAAMVLTPWEPQEVWPLLSASLAARPALIAPYVPRPAWGVPDREALGLAPAWSATEGVYCLRAPVGTPDVTVVLQEAAVTNIFVNDVLPQLRDEGIDVAAYYVASAELFDSLSAQRRREIYPEEAARRAMGITGFTMATMHRWVMSDAGREATLHPFVHGGYLGSGSGASVVASAGLGASGQYEAIRAYLDVLSSSH